MTGSFRLSDVEVGDLEPGDVEHIVRYWYDSPPDYLQSIGVARERLPSRRKMQEALALKLARRETAPTILIIRLGGEGVGVHELTHIEPAVSAVMHAHIWHEEDRRRGIGVVSYVRAMERFFAAHRFERIVFETPRANQGANRLKQKLGIEPVGDGTIYLPIMTRPMETTRFVVQASDLPRLVARLETIWRSREAAASPEPGQ